MKWTKELPICEGWYWWKKEKDYNPGIKHVLKHWRNGILYDEGFADFQPPIEQVGGFWAGPIPMPEEDK